MGEVYRVLYKEADKNSQSSLILKVAPRNPIRREKMRSRDLFVREINMYEKVNLKKIQIKIRTLTYLRQNLVDLIIFRRIPTIQGRYSGRKWLQ